jgi:PKD repeat protein
MAYGELCICGSFTTIDIKFPDALGRTEPIHFYVKSHPGTSGFSNKPGGECQQINDTDWAYVGIYATTASTHTFRTCLSAGKYFVKFETDHFWLDDGTEFNIFDNIEDRRLNRCPYYPGSLTLIPKTNAAGEYGFDILHGLVICKTINPSTISPCKVTIDGTVIGYITSDSGISIPLTQGNHTVKYERYGYDTYEGMISVLHGDVFSVEPYIYNIPMTKNPPNACGQYDDNPDIQYQTDAKMIFRCTPTGGTLSSYGLTSDKIVPEGGLEICMPSGFTWLVSYSKPGYATKDINVTITEEMCETMTTYPVDVDLGIELPIPSFTIENAYNIHPGDNVSLVDTSTGVIDSWVWEIYQSSNPTNASVYYSPNVQFIAPPTGIYTVKLTVYNISGSATKQRGLEIKRPLVVSDFKAVPTEGCAPFTTQFTSLQSGTANHAWSFGDGTFSGDNETMHPVHTYTESGIYTVSLSCIGQESSDTETKPGYITVYDPIMPPIASFEPSTERGIAPLTVKFNNLHPDPISCGITHYLWRYNNGDGWKVFDESTSPTRVFETPGTYDISLTVQNDAGMDMQVQMGCITVTEGSESSGWLYVLGTVGLGILTLFGSG